MAGEIDICNLALAPLGQKKITSLLDPKSEVEQTCALFYPIVRDTLLQEHTWMFTLKRKVLQPTGNDPAWGSDIEFQMPANALSVIGIYKTENMNRPIPAAVWRIEDGLIYTPGEDLALCGMRVVDTNKYSMAFIMAFAARMSMEMCISVTENAGLLNTLSGIYGEKLAAAISYDSIQSRRAPIEVMQLINARHGGG